MIHKVGGCWYVECPLCGEEAYAFRSMTEAKEHERELIARMIRFVGMEKAAPGGKPRRKR
jgi:hypothetical protein